MANIKTIQELFWYGMDREVNDLISPPVGMQLNLGAGDKKEIPDTVGLGWRGKKVDVIWKAPDPLPFEDETVAAVHAYHFMEHLTGEHAVEVLREIQRVLKPGGVAYLVTPYYNSQIAANALDHLSWWNEGNWHWLFNNAFYSDQDPDAAWRLDVNLNFIIGIVERNIVMMTQLVKR